MTAFFMLGCGFFFIFALEYAGLFFARLFGFYTIVQERECKVYVLFGKIIAVLDEPGLYFLWPILSWRALVVTYLGNVYSLDLRLDQYYLRSQAVNSEEGAPMGIGVWYEMFISDPVAYLFRNTDPQWSLLANVSNATVRSLSNMPLPEMLENRHKMSQSVRSEVTLRSHEWGYKLGSVYIRKVHFRDQGMIKQIETKVVNRLRQFTAAMRQDGDNQVKIITSRAERVAAQEFAKAAAVRPRIVGTALRQIAEDNDVSAGLFEVLSAQRLLDAPAELSLFPTSRELLAQLVSSREIADASKVKGW